MKLIKTIISLAVLAAIGYGVWWFYTTNKKADMPEEGQQQEEDVIKLEDDTTESIDNALEGINVDEIDGEFEEIDSLIDEL